jgi:uncharacterized protein
MFHGYRILDADVHVIEPLQIWKAYLEPEYRDHAQITEVSRSEESSTYVKQLGWKGSFVNATSLKRIRVNGMEIYHKLSDKVLIEGSWLLAERYPDSVLAGFSPESQVKVMKKMGVDLSFLYPTMALWLLAIENMDSNLAGVYARTYNNWLRDFCSYDPRRLRGVGAISLHDPQQMVPELQRVAKFGWKAVFLRPNPIKGRVLSDQSYEPFWAECERLGIAVSIHEGTHCRLPTSGADRFHTRFALHACSHPLEQMMALLALIEGGVLERHPNLRVAFLEAGCGWLPYWLWRLDELEYKNLAWEVADNVKMKPSEYFRRQCFISCELDEPYIPELIKYIGEDKLLFGSDYPHLDHSPDIHEDIMRLEKRLGRRVVKKILWDNPRDFYGLT